MTIVGFGSIVGGIYWYAVDGSMGILFIVFLGVVCVFFAGDQI